MQKAFRVCVLCCVSAVSIHAGFLPISLGSVSNTTLATFPGMLNGNLFPTGSHTYNGVPFTVDPTWSADVAAGGVRGAGLEQVTIPVNAFGVTTIYSLMGSEWGQTTGTFVSLTFTFGDGSTYTVGLAANQAIRDYNNYTWTNSISGAWSAPLGMIDSTINVWTDDGIPCNGASPSGVCSVANGQYQRLDEQIINIPVAFQNLTLVSLTINDGGDHSTSQDAVTPHPNDAQRSFISGLTVNAGAAPIPEPATWALLLAGIGAFAASRRRA